MIIPNKIIRTIMYFLKFNLKVSDIRRMLAAVPRYHQAYSLDEERAGP